MIGFTIIIVCNNGKVVRAAAPTTQLQRSGRFDWHHFYDVHKSGTLLVADEGITWIRGDHREESSEVESLKAANMLAREDRDPLTDAMKGLSDAVADWHDMTVRNQLRRPSAPPRFRPVPAKNASSFRRR
jgi:hypothetical protein